MEEEDARPTGGAGRGGRVVARPVVGSLDDLGVPGLNLAGNLAVEGTTATIRRDSDDASTTITAELPALVSVTDQTGEARYPAF